MPDLGTRADAASSEWDFALPSLGADMDSGTVIEWYVKAGATVERGDLIAMVSTEKADIDIEIWHPGVVSEFLVGIGEHVPVGTPILRLRGEPGGSEAPGATKVEAVETATTTPAAPTPAAPIPAAPTTAAPTTAAPTTAAPTTARAAELDDARPAGPTPTASDGLRASPLARSMAADLGVDLDTIDGTGPGGAILARDVAGYSAQAQRRPPAEAEAPTPVAADEPEDRATSMRRVIAERMSRANRDIPHYHLELDIDMTPLTNRLLDRNEALPVAQRILPAAAILKATAMALAATPQLNGAWNEGAFEQAETVDIAVAISLRGGGLVTPTITDVDHRSLAEIMAVLREMVTGARRGSLRSSWMREAGVTVTNLGERGADRVHGVVFPPQVALVGFGRIRERPWVVDGVIEPRSVLTASLAADHRCTDGATGSRFLTVLDDHLHGMEVP